MSYHYIGNISLEQFEVESTEDLAQGQASVLRVPKYIFRR